MQVYIIMNIHIHIYIYIYIYIWGVGAGVDGGETIIAYVAKSCGGYNNEGTLQPKYIKKTLLQLI